MAKDNKIYVKIYGQNEYRRLLNVLEDKQYHWQSGQRAIEPPLYVRKMTDKEGNDVVGIRILSLNKKTIGFYPIEILNRQTRLYILKRRCVSVDDAIKVVKIKERMCLL